MCYFSQKTEGSDSILGQTEYLQTVGNAGLSDAVNPGMNVGVEDRVEETPGGTPGGSVKEEETSAAGEPAFDSDTSWENSSGSAIIL